MNLNWRKPRVQTITSQELILQSIRLRIEEDCTIQNKPVYFISIFTNDSYTCISDIPSMFGSLEGAREFVECNIDSFNLLDNDYQQLKKTKEKLNNL